MSEEATPTEAVLHAPGSIPGIPGVHGPGRYLIDWIERTLTRVEDVMEHIKSEESSTQPESNETPDPAPTSEEQPSEVAPEAQN